MRRARHRPARPLRPDERTLFVEWLAAAGDILSAYVSDRRSDSVALQHRIVITTNPTEEPSHLVFALIGRGTWMVLSFGSRTRVRRFASLRAALNLVRPVLYQPGQ